MVIRKAKPTDTFAYNIILIDKSSPEYPDGALSESEREFVRQGIQNDIRQYAFFRPGGMCWIRVLDGPADYALHLEDVRLAGAEALVTLKQYKVAELCLDANGVSPDAALAFAEGLALAGYQFQKYQTGKEKDRSPDLVGLIHDRLADPDVEALDVLVDTVRRTRDMVNEPHSHFNTLDLAAAVRAAAQEFGLSVEVLGKEKLESMRMGGLLAVNAASNVPAQFCILEWQPEGALNDRPVVLVGKGVVYDTGGLSLKTPEGMEYMKCDMAGAAAAAMSIVLAARKKIPIHLIALIPATDNKIGEKAISPGDVITMYAGKTVEVVNTDAEGRLILADALHYAKKFNPELVIDFATLTGAAARALGPQAICYMGNAPAEIKQLLEQSGQACYERLVELPLWREYGEELKSPVADIRNVGGASAGMITAGKFLEHFVDFPWLHLDIAGPAYLRTPTGYRTREGTGVGVRLMDRFFINYLANKSSHTTAP